MNADRLELKDFFQQELVSLHSELENFTSNYPTEAAELGLGRQGSRDPQMEMLVRSFAFLTSRVRFDMESVKTQLPNMLLDYLHPHLAAPLPCMLVARMAVRPDTADGARLERGRIVGASVTDSSDRSYECRFSTTCDTPLAPLKVQDVEIVRSDRFEPWQSDAGSSSLLRVRLLMLGHQPLHSLKTRRLRFYLDASQPHAYLVHELLQVHLERISRTGIGDESGWHETLDHCKLQWMGFADEQAALPQPVNVHPGLRLLQEYFAFPEKFMFFELEFDDFAQLGKGMDLFFHFNVPIPPEVRVHTRLLRLNCVPLVNLYPQRIDPLRLDHTQSEYWLRADTQAQHLSEVYSIDSLVAIASNGSECEIHPYFDMEGLHSQHVDDYFYLLRRTVSTAQEVDGTETYVSFLDQSETLSLPQAEVIGGRAVCTNRRLPEGLQVGQDLRIHGASSAVSLKIMSQPTPHGTPKMLGDRPWMLVSQLGLNHLSLAQGPQALGALKSLLRTHIGPARARGLRAIDGLVALSCTPVVRFRFQNGQRSCVNALQIELTLNRDNFPNGGEVLFASVLRHFFALYASVNTLVEVSLKHTDSRHVFKRWEALEGAKLAL